jgi:integrase
LFLMYLNHRKRREPVVHRGQRVPNLYRRPKPPSDRREGDTYEVIYRDGDGRQRQKTLRARTVQRAISEAEEHRSKLRRGEILPPSKLTFGEVAEEFLQTTTALVTTGERSKGTLDLYRQRYRSHVEPTLGRKRIQDVRAEHIGAIFARQRERNLASWTISGTQAIISAILTFAISRDYISSSPLQRLAKIEKPRQVSKREHRRLTDAEVRGLCEAATPRYKPVVSTLAWTGLRVSEALGLRWEDVDFEHRVIRVRYQLDESGKLKPPKTKAGKRTIPLLPTLEQELRNHRRNQLALGLAGNEQLVFTTATGKPLDRHNVRNQGITAAANKAGLNPERATKLTTHDLRRTFISHLILGLNLDPVQVAKIVGHSNVSLTLNTYADEFDKARHQNDLFERIERSGFGSVSG